MLFPGGSAWHDYGRCKNRAERRSGRTTESVEESAIKRELKTAADTAEDITNSRALELVARAGFAVSGILHLLIGVVAIRLAMGGQGKADVSGAVEQLGGQPAGPLLLWTSFAACVALAIWQASDAIFDFEHLPAKKKLAQEAQSRTPGRRLCRARHHVVLVRQRRRH